MRKRETRKVQQVGGGTLTVSLPKEWARAMDIEAGSEIVFEKNNDGSLTLSPFNEPEPQDSRCTIDADQCDDGLLRRCIVGGYILGYGTIEITASTLEQETVTAVHRTMRRLNGISITERTDTSIVLRNFVDPSDASIYVIIRRLSSTVLHMLDSSLYALLQGRSDLIEEVRQMEDDVDILYWLILRQLLASIESERLMDQIGVASSLHLAGNRTAVKALEGMGDCIESIAGQVEHLIEEAIELTQQQQEKLSKVSEALHDDINQAVEALIEQDIEQANALLQHENNFSDKASSLLSDIEEKHDSLSVNIAFNKIVWNMERIVNYAEFIAEITINRAMEQETADSVPIVTPNQ